MIHHHMKKKIPCSERKTSTRLHYVHNLTQSIFISQFLCMIISKIYIFLNTCQQNISGSTTKPGKPMQ